MAREIATQQTGLSGSTLYATLDSGGQRWNGTAFEAVLLAHWGTYAVAMAEATGTGFFAADQPGGIAAGTPLAVTVYRRVGGSPAATDPVVAAGPINPSVNVGSIAGSTLAANNLKADEEASPPTIPTATQVADAVLTRDWTAITGSVPARSTLNALRWLRNAWAIVNGVLTVKKEDDSTTAWSKPVTEDAAADPVTGAGVG